MINFFLVLLSLPRKVQKPLFIIKLSQFNYPYLIYDGDMIIRYLLLSQTESMASSFILGLLFTTLFFLFSFFLVIGIKFFLIYLLKDKHQTQPVKEIHPVVKRKKVSKPKIRYFEIDPDDVDHVIVKKSS